MESDEGKASDLEEITQKDGENLNVDMSHQDLSDVSDLESIGGHSEEEEEETVKPTVDLRQKIEDAKNKKVMEKQLVKYLKKLLNQSECKKQNVQIFICRSSRKQIEHQKKPKSNWTLKQRMENVQKIQFQLL